MHPQTRANLLTAMRGEAFAFAKYRLCAVEARKHGRPELAELFDRAAGDEYFDHFTRQALLAGVIATDADNLHDAIEEETYEVDELYRRFAEEADAVGDHEVAERFREIRADELRHREAFAAALAGLDQPDLAE